VYGSPASAEDRQQLTAFVSEMKSRNSTPEGGQDAELRAWSLACHALFASSRFQILE
jgi:hypothetical protein